MSKYVLVFFVRRKLANDLSARRAARESRDLHRHTQNRKEKIRPSHLTIKIDQFDSAVFVIGLKYANDLSARRAARESRDLHRCKGVNNGSKGSPAA
jgi:hypothetical protein